MFSIHEYYILHKKKCSYCHYLVCNDYIICKICKKLIHRYCYLDINGYRGIIGCPNCNIYTKNIKRKIIEINY